MTSDFDEVMYEVDSGIDESPGTAGRYLSRFEVSTRIANLAHPFTQDELDEFAEAGEHSGLI